MPVKLLEGEKRGRNARTYYNKYNQLRHIKQLRYWVLSDVLKQKYKQSGDEARSLASFLTPMLHLDPVQRASAWQMLEHPWLRGLCPPPVHETSTAAPVANPVVNEGRVGSDHTSNANSAVREAAPRKEDAPTNGTTSDPSRASVMIPNPTVNSGKLDIKMSDMQIYDDDTTVNGTSSVSNPTLSGQVISQTVK